MPGVVAGTILVFIPVMGTFIVSDILGGRQVILVGNLIQRQFLDARDPTFGSAASLILMVMTLIVTYFYTRKFGFGEEIVVCMNPHRRSPFVLIASVLVYFFLYAPIIMLVLYSFNASRANVTSEGFIPKFSERVVMDGSLVKSSPCGPFHWFCELSKNRDVGSAARNTLTVAFVATIVSTIIGTMAALALQRYDFKIKPFSQLSLYIPIVIPEIVMGIGILTLFSQLFGIINNALGLNGAARLSLGLGTVIVSHIAFMVPFVTLVVQARLQGFDKSFEEAAMDLGRTNGQLSAALLSQ
jgi:ABC-type spermidine/putrescine transport system permease subunit II